jgi:hypothetical protein
MERQEFIDRMDAVSTQVATMSLTLNGNRGVLSDDFIAYIYDNFDPMVDAYLGLIEEEVVGEDTGILREVVWEDHSQFPIEILIDPIYDGNDAGNKIVANSWGDLYDQLVY